MDTPRKINRLLGLEIDEVSLVDRPANQHGLVTITKRDEGPMTLFDADGNEVDPGTLEFGDVVYDENDEEFEYVDPDTAQALADEGEELYVPEAFLAEAEDEGDPAEERELVGVGKAGTSAMPNVFQAGKKVRTRALEELENLRGGYSHGRTGSAPNRVPTTAGTARAGAHIGRNDVRYAGGAGAVGTAEGYRRGRGNRGVHKSLGDQVLVELSKAVTDGDRDQVISKAMGEVSKAQRVAAAAIAKAERLEAERELDGYVELAKSYSLPVDPEDLGPILQVIAKSGLSDDQLELVDRVFYAAGESVAYDTLGADGIAPSAVEEVVKAYAQDVVAKSDLTEAQATVAMFEQNPDLYLEYLDEH